MRTCLPSRSLGSFTTTIPFLNLALPWSGSTLTGSRTFFEYCTNSSPSRRPLATLSLTGLVIFASTLIVSSVQVIAISSRLAPGRSKVAVTASSPTWTLKSGWRLLDAMSKSVPSIEPNISEKMFSIPLPKLSNSSSPLVAITYLYAPGAWLPDCVA